MLSIGYSRYDLDILLSPLHSHIAHIVATKKEFKRAKDISKKRDIPLADAFHAIISRDHHAIMITRDRHFELLKDIVKSDKPEDII